MKTNRGARRALRKAGKQAKDQAKVLQAPERPRELGKTVEFGLPADHPKAAEPQIVEGPGKGTRILIPPPRLIDPTKPTLVSVSALMLFASD